MTVKRRLERLEQQSDAGKWPMLFIIATPERIDAETAAELARVGWQGDVESYPGQVLQYVINVSQELWEGV